MLQAALSVLEGNELRIDEFAEAVELVFETTGSDKPPAMLAALAHRKEELLQLSEVLSKSSRRRLSHGGRAAHSDLVGDIFHTYPKAAALAALRAILQAQQMHMQSYTPRASPIPQGDRAEGLIAEDVEILAHDNSLACSLGNAVDMKHEAERKSASESPVDEAMCKQGPADEARQESHQLVVNFSARFNVVNKQPEQTDVLTKLRMPSDFSWNEPVGEAMIAPQVGSDAGTPGHPLNLTESQLLVPDTYPSEPQPEAAAVMAAQVQTETQYHEVLQDEEMPDQEAEALSEDEGLVAENQENCSLHSNSQALDAGAALLSMPSQGKKPSQEDSSKEHGSQGFPRLSAPHGTAPAEFQELHIDPASGSHTAVQRDPVQESLPGQPEAADGSAEPNASLGAAATEVQDAMQAPAPEVMTDVEESFHDVQIHPSTEAESDDDSSESDYDSPSWEGSGHDLLGSEQHTTTTRSQSQSQARHNCVSRNIPL